jgi:serine phosphatase RsbU (regulator of sigma subunit)
MLARLDRAGFSVLAECRGESGAIGGGDFYTIAVRAPGQIGVVVGDTCGHGAEGEAQLSRIFPRLHELALSGVSPGALLTELNRTVVSELPMDRFVTGAAFELDVRAGTFTVANAAHVPAIVRRAGSRYVSVVGRPSGAPLGIAKNATYVAERHELGRGDVIVLMTDGVLEAVESDLVTMSTLKRLLAEASGGAREVHRILLRKFEECTKGGRADDMTLLVLEVTPTASWISRERVERCACSS